MDQRYLNLSCYGKLPCWREYLSVNVGGPAAGAFREWMHSGRGVWLADDTGVGAEGEGTSGVSRTEQRDMRFLFAPPGSSELLVGFLRPSRDKGGRRFPFATFVQVKLREFGRRSALLPLAVVPAWDALEEMNRSFAEFTQDSQFHDAAESSSVPAPEAASLTRTRYRELTAGSTSHLFDGASSAFPNQVVESLGRLAEKAADGNMGKGVRMELPVSDDLGAAALDMTFWIDMVNHRFSWQRLVPSIFLDATPGVRGRRALFIHGEPVAKDYALVFGDAADRQHLPRPAQPPAPPKLPDAAATVGKDAVSHPSYAQLLDKAGAHRPRFLAFLD